MTQKTQKLTQTFLDTLNVYLPEEAFRMMIARGAKHIHTSCAVPARAYLENEIVFFYAPEIGVEGYGHEWGRGHFQAAKKTYTCTRCDKTIPIKTRYMKRTDHTENGQGKFCIECAIDNLFAPTTYNYNKEETPMETQNTDIATQHPTQVPVEKALLQGDLSSLSPQERIAHYLKTCETLGLNPMTKPFDYLNIKGTLVLYARKDCTDQLRNIRSVNIKHLQHDYQTINGSSFFMVTADAELPNNRQDSSIGAVCLDGLKGENLANAIMKAETKAKRRVTLSICGLGILDESEISSIKFAKVETIHDTPIGPPAPLSEDLVEHLRLLLQKLAVFQPKPYEEKLQAFEAMMAKDPPSVDTENGIYVLKDIDIENKIRIYEGALDQLMREQQEEKVAQGEPIDVA